MTIQKEDVLQVAKQLRFEPTDEQIKETIEMFDEECENDPSATWDLVVENILYTLEVKQLPK